MASGCRGGSAPAEGRGLGEWTRGFLLTPVAAGMAGGRLYSVHLFSRDNSPHRAEKPCPGEQVGG